MKPGKRALTYRDIMALSEQERYEHSIYHRWNHASNRRKLARLYGRVAERQDAAIIRAITGCRILDVGAGYGFLTRRLIERGFAVTAIDPNQELVGLAHQWYKVKVLRHDVHELPFPAGSFDTAVFREAVEHLDCEQAFRELARVGCKEILIFQSHLTPVVRLCRRLTGHEELRPEGVEYYRALLRRLGYTEQHLSFRDPFALPLSGGTLTRQLIPPLPALEALVVAVDEAVQRLLRYLSLERLFCWRFLLRAQKPSGAREG